MVELVAAASAGKALWHDLVLSGAIEYLDVDETNGAMVAMTRDDLGELVRPNIRAFGGWFVMILSFIHLQTRAAAARPGAAGAGAAGRSCSARTSRSRRA